jgi:hypothetical protein|tara:strand:+ start:1097 stop:1537 length:441 start_codon:yes stop_codon:yes gene_type:complete
MHGNYFYDNLNDILENVKTSEVTSIFFPYLRKSILIDLRSNDSDGPAVILTDMVSTPQERIRSLKQLRPNFPEIEKMIIIPWFRYVDTLITSGIWNALIERTTDVTLKDNDIDSAIIITKLKKIENTHLSEAIMGHKFQTIWKNTT